MATAYGSVRPLRADAGRNRARIVAAAQAAFAERGLDVPLEEIAADAGVGIATLYRRFPAREDLIAACFETRVADYAEAADEALRAADGWSGFCAFVERVCAMQAADRGLKDVLMRSFPRARGLEAHRARAYQLWVRLVERAKSEGSLRQDFVPQDLVLLLMANAGVVQAAGQDAPGAWRRFVGLMLEACRADRAGSLPPPPAPRQLIRAMGRPGITSKSPAPSAHPEAMTPGLPALDPPPGAGQGRRVRQAESDVIVRR